MIAATVQCDVDGVPKRSHCASVSPTGEASKLSWSASSRINRPTRGPQTPEAGVWIRSFANALRSEHRQLPRAGSFVVADEIGVTVFGCELEISMVGREPGVDHLRDRDAPFAEDQRAWRLLAAMASVALDTNGENCLSSHRIIITP
jgi:hypothetical protein